MSKFKVYQLVRVRETQMLGTVLHTSKRGTVRVVIGNRPKLDLERWAKALKKDQHAPTPGYDYAEGELDAYGKKESGDAAV